MIVFFATASTAVSEEILIVINSENETRELSRQELVDLYMGRSQEFPNGNFVIRVDQLPSSDIREAFYQGLVGKSTAEVNAYWARLLFTGRASPPVVVADDDVTLKMVRENRNAIGYIYASQLDDSVKVVMRVE